MAFLFDQVESSSFNKFSTFTASLDGEMIFLNQFFLNKNLVEGWFLCIQRVRVRSRRRIRETYGARR